MIATGLALAALTLLVGLVLAAGIRLLPTVRGQLAAFALLAVGLPLAVVFLSGWVMFHMGDDVKLLAVAVAAASAALLAALLLARDLARPIRRLSASAGELAAGNLAVRVPPDGPAEIARLADSFNEMAEQVELVFEARRELVAWASHDLRTPIASMRAMLEALEDGLARPEQYVPALEEQVRALAALVDDLFELATIDARTLTLELVDADVMLLIESCVRGLTAEAAARGVDLHADGTAARARCAPAKVERVLYNLVANALRHTPADGAVAVRVLPDEEDVTVVVEDTGEGLDKEAERRMFERFWRGERSRSTPGAGLGLAIARGIVELHGGRIWAEARPGGGARVSFTLPAVESRGSRLSTSWGGGV